MDIVKLNKVLLLLRPGASFALHEIESGGVPIAVQIDWLDSVQTRPTDQEIMDGEAHVDALAYREKRAAEYPAIGDQLDALWKGGKSAEDMHNRILAVKAKYPKPQ